MGAGVSYFENVRPPGISYQESASHQSRRFWRVTKAAAEAILHGEEKGSEIVLGQLGPHCETPVKRKWSSYVSVLTLPSCFFLHFSMLIAWKGGG